MVLFITLESFIKIRKCIRNQFNTFKSVCKSNLTMSQHISIQVMFVRESRMFSQPRTIISRLSSWMGPIMVFSTILAFSISKCPGFKRLRRYLRSCSRIIQIVNRHTMDLEQFRRGVKIMQEQPKIGRKQLNVILSLSGHITT